MAAEVDNNDAQPYTWEERPPPDPEVLQLWTEVGNGLEKNQTVVWKSAVESLDHALKNLASNPQARDFCEKHMSSIIGILVEQQPAKIGVHERNCVQESLILSVRIVAQDLAIQVARQSTSKLLPTLAHVFNKRKAFYKGSKGGSWNVNHHHHMVGLPEVRLRVLDRFRADGGFQRLHEYLQQRQQNKATFPPLLWVHEILSALADAIPTRAAAEPVQTIEDDAIVLAKEAMQYVSTCTDDELKKIPTDELKLIQTDLQRIFDRLVATRRSSTYEFYAFWRALVLQLIASQSLPLKLFGWEQVSDLIRACEAHRPPPKGFNITNAGTSFVNGPYVFGGEVTPDGYARPGVEFSYIREIPKDAPDGAGKKLTLFRCTMRSHQKWWFLSEADEEQPGTDRDIDYYQHKAKDYEEAYPPAVGWITCRNSGVEPPPILEAHNVLVPPGAEYDTLEHQLAKWAIENEIVKQVLGDTTIHREVVARSTVLIKFLASMCNRVAEPGSKYCLQASHLLFAWKTCTRKADAAVSLQVYQLLVSILPLCPSSLSIPLLRAVQTSLHESEDKRDYLFEVSEFCSALACGNLVDSKASTNAVLSEEVRAEALNLVWSVLTHPEASSLKPYESLKLYVTHELKVEPKGSEHRERFLQSCVVTMTKNEHIVDVSIDEVQALRMVKLSAFILEACPQEQSQRIASQDNSALPWLVFRDLVAYVKRRQNSPANQVLDDASHSEALQVRLRIVRLCFGLSADHLAADALKELWDLCIEPVDREAVMVFIANASQNGKPAVGDKPRVVVGPQPENLLSSALSEDVGHAVFLDLFCSNAFIYSQLGEGAYRSFQFLFNKIRSSSLAMTSKRVALDALWRMCLTVENDSVAEQAMRDLLLVYVSLRNPQVSTKGTGTSLETMVTDEDEESFGDRIYEYLSRLTTELTQGTASAKLSAQRCLRILKAAIGESAQDPLAISSTLTRLSFLPPEATFEDTIRCLPHGMRGEASYRRIGIIAKGPNQKPPTTTKFHLDVHPLETLASLKEKVAAHCRCVISSVKPIQINGRSVGSGLRSSPTDPAHLNLNTVPEDSVMDELGVVQGCEIVFVITDRPQVQTGPVAPTQTSRAPFLNDLSSYFFAPDGRFADQLYTMLLGILEALSKGLGDSDAPRDAQSTHGLIWDLFLAMPTDIVVSNKVKDLHKNSGEVSSMKKGSDAMEVESSGETWNQLLDHGSFDRSVYVLMTIDSFLQPAPESLSALHQLQRLAHEQRMVKDAGLFRRSFIDTGGFSAVVRFFSATGGDVVGDYGKSRRGNAVALRILTSCLFCSNEGAQNSSSEPASVDEEGIRLLQSLSDVDGLLRSLTAMVVDDEGISSSTIADVLKFLQLLFQSSKAARSFVSLGRAERFLVALLLWDGGPNTVRTSSSVSAAVQVRKTAHDLILQVPLLADYALPWLMNAVGGIATSLESTAEFFDVLEKLVDDENTNARSRAASEADLANLALNVCRKLASCPRPSSETDAAEVSTSVLCGCLKLLRALIEKGGSKILREASNALLSDMQISKKWSSTDETSVRGVFSLVSSSFSSRPRADSSPVVDLMGAIFDGFLCPNASTGVAICCDKESRRRGFAVVGAACRSCETADGYDALVKRVNGLISSTSPKVRNRWGQFGSSVDNRTRGRGASKYSGLRNQGCTCYMNSVLQQLFMMPELSASMCSAPLPASLRSSDSATIDSGAELVGKKISLQWDNGISYDAMVEAFDTSTGMHTIRYMPVHIAVARNAGTGQSSQVQPEDISQLPPSLQDEFVLSEGRPGKETGVFELVTEAVAQADSNGMQTDSTSVGAIKETEDERASRHLLEQVQRTFIHLKEGSKGRCFDPRALVEACACLKLEFDVWQQNDASEFSTKLLDRLEISLKRYAPAQFDYMDHTFGMKQTKQKICKECGLKTNREEKLLNIDCQIRGKSDIHEALSAMTEVEIMEGSNKVYCDSCKKNTDTILRSAISTLPNVLILSLKRFDLDFTTFETVKLNSRCAFGQTLNMKPYTLEGLESVEQPQSSSNVDSPVPMETEETVVKNKEETTGSENIPDEEYEYRLAGVLVHAGVAQGGHYYSFIKDRHRDDSEEKWYRFDDEDVTPFDPSLIESECFGGKVKKETKWPNGQVQTVEQEQFANALMLFYEKVTPTEMSDDGKADEKANEPLPAHVETATGYEAFEPDVRKSNAVHRWQSFLFDSEFQSFMRSMINECRLSITELKLATTSENQASWLEPMADMIFSFVFDILMYSSDLSSLDQWTSELEDILRIGRRIAVPLVQKLARKTRTVSTNWLRTYLLDCPNKSVRSSATQIFSAATITYALSGAELNTLSVWSQAWKEQVEELNQSVMSDHPRPFPPTLEGKWSVHEDISKIENGGTSSLGIILSFCNVLLDAIPRCWRFNTETCAFIRNLAMASLDGGRRPMVRPMVLSMIPTRLIALITREKSPSILRNALPGICLSQEAASIQSRPETNPTAHLMPMTTNAVLNTADMNSQRGPHTSDYLVVFEALCCIGGIPGAVHAPLTTNPDDTGRSRQRVFLTEKAAKALREVFKENCAEGAPGMIELELEAYLRQCGVDAAALTQGKAHDIFSKYPTTEGSAATGDRFLSLEGFLAYYRDCVQSSDIRLRTDLHLFGFRPDLTRRSKESRFVVIRDHGTQRETARSPNESVSIDVAQTLGTHIFDVGRLGNMTMLSSIYFHTVAHGVSEPMMEYLVAATVHGKDVEAFINRTLQTIYQTSNDWAGNERVACAVAMLQAVASMRGDYQQKNIETIMLSRTKVARNVSFGCGLLEVTRALQSMTRSSQYNNDVYLYLARYMSILRDFYSVYPIYQWMNENRPTWAFVERDLMDARVPGQQQNARHEYSSMYTGQNDVDSSGPLEHNVHSDSDMAGMNDSEDDEDSQFDTSDGQVAPVTNDGPFEITIEEAGNPAVNGVYSQEGFFGQACRYARDGRWNNTDYKFLIFQCHVSNNTKHWYISIVPFGGNPGTSSDIDFYTAPVTEECKQVPPTSGWVKANHGKDPPPVLYFRYLAEEGNESGDAEQLGPVVESESVDGPDTYF